MKFQSRALSEQIRLLTMQVELEEATGETACFVDLSVMETITRCIHNATPLCSKYALRIKSEFQISEKKWYRNKIKSLAEVGSWSELKRFMEEKRSPVGYVPFVDAYITGGKSKEAAACMALIPDERVRMDKLEDNQQWMEAAVLATKLSDQQRIVEIYRACQNQKIKADIQVLAIKIGVKLK